MSQTSRLLQSKDEEHGAMTKQKELEASERLAKAEEGRHGCQPCLGGDALSLTLVGPRVQFDTARQQQRCLYEGKQRYGVVLLQICKHKRVAEHCHHERMQVEGV